MKHIFPVIILLLITSACTKSNQASETETVSVVDENPPCEGFNINDSDQKAIEIADNVMKAMGGRQAWDQTRYLTWEFGSRDLLWDKLEGHVRIESSRDTSTYLINIHSMEGRVFKNGVEITDEEELTKRLSRAKSIWINDS